MSRKLPPLNALRAFEAVARHLSFRAAADELHVSHSAVSHHIRALELRFNIQLFIRTTRRVELSAEGARFFPAIKDAFDRIERSTAELSDARLAGILTAQVYVTMAMRWLLPRLSRYQHQHADVEVRLSTSFQEWEFRADGIDVGIILGNEDSSELFYRYLYTGRITPVCAPAMMTGERGLRQPADLSRLPLIDVYTSPNDWNRWLQVANLGNLSRRVSTQYDTHLLALEAAVAGNGIAMAEVQDIDEDIRSGRLVRPFDISITRERNWYIVCKRGRESEAKIKSFMDWVVAEMAERNTSGHRVDNL